MKRAFAIILVGLMAAALFAALVHAVLVAAHLSNSAPTTVQGLTPRRIWATIAIALGLAAVIAGSTALVRAARRIGNRGHNGAILALVAGFLAVMNGGLNLAVATGGPGSGNGVVGGAAAFVLGFIGIALGGLTLSRGRRTVLQSGQLM
jgi:energy-converting hydrogenase Eha subunit A